MVKSYKIPRYSRDDSFLCYHSAAQILTNTKAHSRQRCKEFSTRRMQNLNLR